ncbi:hypothetical protein KEM54_001830 [Ascosphaera aggregata]|nr:hypothetical protein KEM54_001830 [Ascosphaera aggregata]
MSTGNSSTSSMHPLRAFRINVPDKLTATPGPTVQISGIQGGEGETVLLLHGFPQNCNAWVEIMRKLVDHFRVIAIDIRGYGNSSKPTYYLMQERPPTEEQKRMEHDLYSECVMAKDCINMLDELGIRKFYICGHDRGARVAHSVCALFPSAVRKAIFLDISPMLTMYDQTNKDFAQRYFHWFFLTQSYPLPEKCITSHPLEFLKNFMPNCYQLDHRLFLSYLHQLSDFRTVHSICEDYRATATIDYVQAQNDLAENVRLMCPLKVLWAKHGVLHDEDDPDGPLHDWLEVHDNDDVSGEALDCGHFMLDEKPDEIAKTIKEFFVDPGMDEEEEEEEEEQLFPPLQPQVEMIEVTSTAEEISTAEGTSSEHMEREHQREEDPRDEKQEEKRLKLGEDEQSRDNEE